uniref:beta-ketoacyl synthase N-terminal-like domain-containing protein n=1 Tax=Streptomyces specialis TaxID=498367 RepID=UPI000A5F351C
APAPAPVVAAVEPPRWLVDLFADVLGMPAAALDPTALFGDLGVESVMLGELVRRVEREIGRSVEPSALLDHPTLSRLARHLESFAPPAAANAAPVAVTAAARPGEPDGPGERIAVIGMDCRFPGAPDADAFWRLLASGTCAVTEVPATRWDTAALYDPVHAPGRSISRWGGFLDGIEDFDARHFGLTDEETDCLDPALRLVLEGTANCLADAGYRPGEVEGRDVGVFVGTRLSRYGDRIGVRPGPAALGGDQNFAAARVAHHFDLRGPSLVVDSACSSALVAIQQACRSLRAGESELAFVAGVDILLDERPYLEFSAARALSPTGRCATFDRSADGFVPGEGCGVVLLKPLERALADGDRVHAVIEAVAVTNDGRTMGLTTPNPAAQARAVRRALDRAGLTADRIGLVEAHGTGTMIGDPIELRALTDVFRETTADSGFCAIGSVKSNIGHLLSAAGIAGLAKAVLALRHAQVPPTLFCDEPNPRFDFASSPFVPNTGLREWPAPPDGAPRAAGVSAFGLGGTNAHLVVTEPPRPARGGVREPLPRPRYRRRRHWLD